MNKIGALIGRSHILFNLAEGASIDHTMALGHALYHDQSGLIVWDLFFSFFFMVFRLGRSRLT
jgi:hypothetical protein